MQGYRSTRLIVFYFHTLLFICDLFFDHVAREGRMVSFLVPKTYHYLFQKSMITRIHSFCRGR